MLFRPGAQSPGDLFFGTFLREPYNAPAGLVAVGVIPYTDRKAMPRPTGTGNILYNDRQKTASNPNYPNPYGPEDCHMVKPFRSLFVCGIFLLAASVTVSAAGSPALLSPTNPAVISYLVAPKLHLCQDEIPKVVISYKYDEAFRSPKSSDSGDLAPLAPLAPLDPLVPSNGSAGSSGDDVQPGRIVTTGNVGNVQASDQPVGWGPSTLTTHYVPTGTGAEILKSTLTYATYSNFTRRGFNVEDCQYRLVIDAWNEREADDGAYLVFSWISAGGDLSVDTDGNIQGSLEVDAGFQMVINNDIEVCMLTPTPTGSGTATVFGQMTKPMLGGEPYPSLTVSYKGIVGFPKASFVCANKKTGDTFTAPSPIQPPSSVNPAEYLKTELKFSSGNEINGSYGKGGTATYYFMKRY
jgi:hypothetical protein